MIPKRCGATELGIELRDEVSALHEALNRLNSLHKQIGSLQEYDHRKKAQDRGTTSVAYKPVLEEARALDKKITAIQEPLYNNEIQPGSQDDIHYLQRFQNRLQGVMRGVMGGPGEAPSQILVDEATEVRKELETQLAQVNTFLNTEVSNFNKKAAEHGSSTLFAGGPIQIKPGAGVTSAASTGNEEEMRTGKHKLENRGTWPNWSCLFTDQEKAQRNGRAFSFA